MQPDDTRNVVAGSARDGSALVPSQRLIDPPVRRFLTAVDALGIDVEQNINTVSGPLCYLGHRHACIEHSETAACRRAYGRSASGDTSWAGRSAKVRAMAQVWA
jgi:hypothetical protein